VIATFVAVLASPRPLAAWLLVTLDTLHDGAASTLMSRR